MLSMAPPRSGTQKSQCVFDSFPLSYVNSIDYGAITQEII